ncbi:hypothetical protein L6452_20733 [Arctium lappa]|uniref:Uncharacterized protein n=1 Tax=Arctium lappa TaxID=4217 RepID=A0ACB9BD04_ARCLA|nr:hypothetical protein L6452_20733 [Arctium lappa]
MGSLLCCLRGAAVDEEDGGSNENEQVQEPNNTSNRSTAQVGFAFFAQDLRKMYDILSGRVTGPPESSSSTRDGKGLNRSHVEPELVHGSDGLTFACDEDCASSKDDECLICLEEYTDENPRITTKCSHHSHLSCILEWQQRSELCPVCSELMEFEEMS